MKLCLSCQNAYPDHEIVACPHAWPTQRCPACNACGTWQEYDHEAILADFDVALNVCRQAPERERAMQNLAFVVERALDEIGADQMELTKAVARGEFPIWSIMRARQLVVMGHYMRTYQ